MNTKKIIKYTLIAIPLLFLAKWGIESVIYNSNKTPEINPNPTHKIRVHGKFPFEDDVNMQIAILYITTNPECDNNNWLAGIRFAQMYMKPFSTTTKNGTFESTVYLDSYLPGVCKWRAHNIFTLMEKKRSDLGPMWTDQVLTDEQSDENISSAALTRVGTIGYEPFLGQGKVLQVECIKKKIIFWKGLPKEENTTGLGCTGKQNHHDSRGIINLVPDVLNSQKEVELNFIDKGWRK